MPFVYGHPVLAVLASIAGAGVMLAWRVRETQTPVSLMKIIAPPAGMSTGFFMFLAPAPRVPLAWAGLAFAAGVLIFSIPLTRTSRLVRRGDEVLMERSKAFIWILLGLFLVRYALRAYIEQIITPMQTGALFFILAFGMIVRWRLTMLFDYLRLRESSAQSA